MSLLIHMAILLFLAYKIALWLPQQQVLEQQPVEDVFMADDTSADDDVSDSETVGTPVQNDSDVAMPSDTATVSAQSEEQTQQENKEPDSNKDNDGNNKDKEKHRPRQNNSLTTALNTNDPNYLYQLQHRPKPTMDIEHISLSDDVLPIQQPISVEAVYQVEADGTVINIKITKTSGNDDIDDIVIRAMEQWHFSFDGPASPIVWTANFRCNPGDDVLSHQ